MTFEQLIKLCKPIDISGPEPQDFETLTQDSRKVEKNSVFIAIKGLQADGHTFIDEAIAKGASVIISEETYYTDKEVCILEVPNTRSLLGPLAQAFHGYPARKLKAIGITGTNGKTTVATLVYQLLKEMGGARPALLSTVAKYINDEVIDSRLTTSDPIELARDMQQMVNARATHMVMEVSSHALKQERVNGINFLVGAFTNLSHDHLDYHSSMEEYAETKKKLFDNLNSDAWAVINADDKKSSFIALDCPAQIIDFSFEKPLSYECSIISNTSEGLTLKIDGVTFETSLVGTFNAYNVAEAVLICRALGYEFTTIARALKSASGAAGRLERVQTDFDENQPIVLVDYAHTPDALENVLSTLSNIKTYGQILHVIFGCGGDRDPSKRPKMAAIAEQYANVVTVTSDNPRSENPDDIIEDIITGFKQSENVQTITARRKAIEQVVTEAPSDAMILIAGKGHETYQEIKGERIDFDDREIARSALSNRKEKKANGEVH